MEVEEEERGLAGVDEGSIRKKGSDGISKDLGGMEEMGRMESRRRRGERWSTISGSLEFLCSFWFGCVEEKMRRVMNSGQQFMTHQHYFHHILNHISTSFRHMSINGCDIRLDEKSLPKTCLRITLKQFR